MPRTAHHREYTSVPRKKTVATPSSPETHNAGTAEGLDFESALSELEALVERMEQGEMTLEQSLADFERGIALTRTCQNALKAAEQKVSLLADKNGEAALTDFAPDDD